MLTLSRENIKAAVSSGVSEFITLNSFNSVLQKAKSAKVDLIKSAKVDLIKTVKDSNYVA